MVSVFRMRSAQLAVAFVTVLLAMGGASQQQGAGAPSLNTARDCMGAAELRVVNRTNRVLELVEYDTTTKTTIVIGVIEPGVSNFSARGDSDVIHALREFSSTTKVWLTTDRRIESSESVVAIERRCR